MLTVQAIEPLAIDAHLERQPTPRSTPISAVLRPTAEARTKSRPVAPIPLPVTTKASQPAPLLRQNLTTGRVEISIMLLPGFPLYDLSALCDTFAAANRQADRHVFTWRLFSLDGKPVACSLGSLVTPSGAFDNERQPDNILLLSGTDFSGTERLQAWLRQAVSRHAHVLGSGAAVGLMVKAGLLGGKACTAHWSSRDALQEDWPALDFSDKLYVAQDRRVTCAGGKALIDFALACIAAALGDAATRQIADGLNHDRLRPGNESQHPSPAGMRGIHNRVLLKAMELIERSLAEPLSTDDLAIAVGICPRQLQRLFKKQFDMPPGQFAMQRRMQKARQLLHQTEMSITEVGVALGFISLSHFSRCYAKAFGRQPRQDRLRLICD